MRGASLSLCVQLLNLHLTTWHALQQQLQRVHTTWKKYLTRRPSRLQRNSPQIPTTNNLKQRNSPRKIPTTNKQTISSRDRHCCWADWRSWPQRIEGKAEEEERGNSHNQTRHWKKELKETRETERRDVCVWKNKGGSSHKWGGNLDKPQVGRKLRRCKWRGEEQRIFSSINGNRSFQATRERERDAYRSRAA